jgi:hypothetical protein
MKNIILVILIVLSGYFDQSQSIIGSWQYEDDPKLTWVFTSSGELIEKYGDTIKVRPRLSSVYTLLNRSQSCSHLSTDSENEEYLKINDPNLGVYECYYLVTLSNEVLVLINTSSGKMLLFNRV